MRKNMAKIASQPHIEFGEAVKNENRIYIFVAAAMAIGGMETLLVRMANQIASLGYSVFVVAEDGPLAEALDIKVTLLKVDQEKSLVSQLKKVPLKSNLKKPKVYVWAATPYALASVYKYQQHLFHTERINSVSISGIFGPARAVHGFRNRYNAVKHLLILGWLPRRSVYFMSEAVRKTYVQHLGAYFSKWPIQKLAVNQTELNWKPREDDRLKIVSVGRITSFKPYNFAALDIAESMKEKDIPVQWDIWGHGDEAEILQEAIHDRGLSSHIKFHGALPYSQFNDVVLDSDLFVGMGTAALEAAQLGTPTIVALTWSKFGTYGFLHQCPNDSIGEQYAGTEEYNLDDVIQSYRILLSEQRIEIGLKCREAVLLKTSGDAPPFESIFEGGIRYPGNFAASLRMATLGLAKNVRDAVKLLENFYRNSIGRSL